MNQNKTKLQQFTVEFNNSEEFHHLKKEIFTYDHYYFETDNVTPTIIDAGAHIGLSTLYFKKLYPLSRIIAFEPLPENFELLEKNVWDNNLEQVETHRVALSDSGGTQTFYFDQSGYEWWSTASFIEGAWTRTQHSLAIPVPTEPLAPYLDQAIDFLKMDIEGAEYSVLKAARAKLPSIKHAMVEFHPHAGYELEQLVELFEQTGFATTLWKKGKAIPLNQARGLLLVEAVRR